MENAFPDFKDEIKNKLTTACFLFAKKCDDINTNDNITPFDGTIKWGNIVFGMNMVTLQPKDNGSTNFSNINFISVV